MRQSRDEHSEHERRRLRVRGRVQGVFFRASTCERASSLGLVGWVRNREDGSVEIEAEGARPALEQLVAWARRGPQGARVDAVKVEEIEPRGPLAREASFELRG